MKNKTALFIVFALALGTATCAVQASDKFSGTRFQKALAAGIAVPVVGYGLYRVARWALGGEYSEKMLARAEKMYQEMVFKYAPLQTLKINISNLAETDLARVMQNYGDIKIAASAQSDMQRLSAMRNTLEQRIARDKALKEPVIDALQKMVVTLKELEDRLGVLAQLWQTHGVYFQAHELLGKLVSKYGAFKGKTSHKDFIKKQLMAHGIKNQYDYPHLSYGRELQSDITALTERMKNSAHYPALYRQCEMILQDMQDMLTVVVGFPDYMQEVHLKRQHDLEQERIENERRRAEAERQRARIEQERINRERARENAEMFSAIVSGISNATERARAEAEKARLEKERLELEKARWEFEQQKKREQAKEQAKQTQSVAQPTYVRPPAYNPASQQPAKLYPDLNNFNPNPAPSAPPMDDEHFGDD